MDWNEIPEINGGFTERDLGDEVVLLSEDGAEIHSLDTTGLWIWEKIREGLSPDGILNKLLDEYEVEEVRARKDLEEFISDLKSKKVIR